MGSTLKGKNLLLQDALLKKEAKIKEANLFPPEVYLFAFQVPFHAGVVGWCDSIG